MLVLRIQISPLPRNIALCRLPLVFLHRASVLGARVRNFIIFDLIKWRNDNVLEAPQCAGRSFRPPHILQAEDRTNDLSGGAVDKFFTKDFEDTIAVEEVIECHRTVRIDFARVLEDSGVLPCAAEIEPKFGASGEVDGADRVVLCRLTEDTVDNGIET